MIFYWHNMIFYWHGYDILLAYEIYFYDGIRKYMKEKNGI